MKRIHLIIRGLGGAQPVINVNGTTGQIFAFMWDRKRSAHVKTWEVSDEATRKKFVRESEEILNQRLMWPVFVDVSTDEAGEDQSVALTVAQAAITELKAENSALKEALVASRSDLQAVDSSQVEVPPVPPLTRQQKAAITRMDRKAA